MKKAYLEECVRPEGCPHKDICNALCMWESELSNKTLKKPKYVGPLEQERLAAMEAIKKR